MARAELEGVFDHPSLCFFSNRVKKTHIRVLFIFYSRVFLMENIFSDAFVERIYATPPAAEGDEYDVDRAPSIMRHAPVMLIAP